MLERLTEKDREFIKSQVGMGYYASEIEVVRDALRRLREKTEAEKHLYLRAMAQKGHEQLNRGEGELLDKSGMDKIAEEALEYFESGKPIKDEVQG